MSGKSWMICCNWMIWSWVFFSSGKKRGKYWWINSYEIGHNMCNSSTEVLSFMVGFVSCECNFAPPVKLKSVTCYGYLASFHFSCCTVQCPVHLDFLVVIQTLHKYLMYQKSFDNSPTQWSRNWRTKVASAIRLEPNQLLSYYQLCLKIWCHILKIL